MRGSALFILPRWFFLSGCPTCIVCVSVFTVGKPHTVEIQSPPPGRADLTAVLLSYLLDVHSSPGKHIHKLRVLTALLITMPKAEISIVSPCVHFSWVCNEEENQSTRESHHCFHLYHDVNHRSMVQDGSFHTRTLILHSINTSAIIDVHLIMLSA